MPRIVRRPPVTKDEKLACRRDLYQRRCNSNPAFRDAEARCKAEFRSCQASGSNSARDVTPPEMADVGQACPRVLGFCASLLKMEQTSQVDRLLLHMTYNDLYSIFRRNLWTRGDRRLRATPSKIKPELASWLVKVVRNTCQAIQSGTLRTTALLIANRFHLCCSPGSLDNYSQMMTIFNEQLTSDVDVTCRTD